MTRLALLAAVLLLAALAIWHPVPRATPIAVERSAPIRTAEQPRVTTPGTVAVVYVVGAVARPGLYHLPVGSRVDDAVRSAGGLLIGADRSAVNLAERVSDGEEIAVPKTGDAAAPRTRRTTRSAKHRGRRASSPPLAVDPVDLNAADVATLEQLPGVGPALAQRIVAYRELNGPFVSLDELADVAGMTDRRVEQVAPFLIVH